MPRSVVRQVQERVGPREFSQFVTEAVRWRLQRAALDDYLAEAEAQNGPPDPDAVQRYLRLMS